MGTDMTAEEFEEVVMTWVSQQKADVLEKVYEVIPLICPGDVKGKRLKLLNTLLAHLVGLDETESVAAIKRMHGFMTSQGSDIKPTMPALEGDSGTLSSNLVPPVGSKDAPNVNVASKSSSVVDLVRFKEFKISGTIFGKGETRISFASLKHLVENAQKMQYSETMISSAIIKAISPSHKVKSLLESKRGITVKEIIEMLRAHYKKEDRSSVLTDLRTAVQQPTESALDFVTELMCLKSRVIELSREESYPIDLLMLTKDLFQSMFTGMRNPNIRSELREVFSKHSNQNDIDDGLLTKYVADAMANEDERQKKLMGAKAAAATNVVESEPVKPQHKQRDNPFDKIEELRLTQEKEMSMLRADFAEVKTALLGIPKQQNQSNDGGGGPGSGSWQDGRNSGGRQPSNSGSAMQQGGLGMHSSNSFAAVPGHGFAAQSGTGNFAPSLAGQGWYAPNQAGVNAQAGGYGYGMPQGGYAPMGYGPQPGGGYGGFGTGQNSQNSQNPQNQNPQNGGNFNGGNFNGGNGGSSRGRGGNGGSRRHRNKCDACQQGNVRFCVHCLRCGSDNHRANACPGNSGGNGNGNGGGNGNGNAGGNGNGNAGNGNGNPGGNGNGNAGGNGNGTSPGGC